MPLITLVEFLLFHAHRPLRGRCAICRISLRPHSLFPLRPRSLSLRCVSSLQPSRNLYQQPEPQATRCFVPFGAGPVPVPLALAAWLPPSFPTPLVAGLRPHTPYVQALRARIIQNCCVKTPFFPNRLSCCCSCPSLLSGCFFRHPSCKKMARFQRLRS